MPRAKGVSKKKICDCPKFGRSDQPIRGRVVHVMLGLKQFSLFVILSALFSFMHVSTVCCKVFKSIHWHCCKILKQFLSTGIIHTPHCEQFSVRPLYAADE